MTTPLTEAELREIEERASKATPPEQLALDCYPHGGARLASPANWLTDSSNRNLVADFYDESNREFYFHARTDIPRLLSALREKDEELERRQIVIDNLSNDLQDEHVRHEAELAAAKAETERVREALRSIQLEATKYSRPERSVWT